MLKRKMTQILKQWRREAHKPCLLLQGARQVGKTYLVDAFARQHYRHYIYINFELSPEYKKIFEGNLDFGTLRLNLEANFPNTPIRRGETLLFLDEIQACPQARVALKTFALDGTLDVIASGSLLGLYYKEVSSYPVGYERAVELYPLDFEEFLWALGITPELMAALQTSFRQVQPLNDSILQRFNDYFRQYLLVGGMPNVVNDYLQTHSLQRVRARQREITGAYKNDVLKYASITDKPKILKTFESIPAQLARKNKKFAYTLIDRSDAYASERKYASAIMWLKDAGIVNFCYNLREPALPLAVNKRLETFKIYLRDTGLLLSMMEPGVTQAIVTRDLEINQGAILENVCAEEIISRHEQLYYFEKKSRLEIDFIIDLDGVVTAVEVKSGGNNQAKSLRSVMDNYKTVRRYIKLERDTNIYRDIDGIEHYPLFAMMFL